MIERAEGEGADLIEVRLDYIDSMDGIKEAIKNASVPLIATNRQYEQGGYRPKNEDDRVQTLIKAADIGFQYVDIELTSRNLKKATEKIKDLGARLIISFHNFKDTPPLSEMEKIIKAQMKTGAEVCKLVTTANDAVDNVRCMLLAWKMSQLTKIVCFAMGERGIISRALSPLFGAYFTYASLESSLETASGQISISALKDLYKRLGVKK